jgi:ABC-type antimicrobial peptide transport system permease subunit
VLKGAAIASRIETRDRLTTEPLAVAMIGALSLGFVIAGLFAVIGLAVSASVSARQRRGEFALLRALGLSPRQLSGWLWVENASVVAVAVVAGTALGLVIGWVVLPFVTVSAAGAAPFPPVVVDVPWPSVALLIGVSAGALVITLIVLVRAIRRAGIGSVLRMGEE